MSNRLVYAVAKHCKMQLDEVENVWRRAKRTAKDEGYGNDYAYTVAKFAEALGVNDILDEVSTMMSVQNTPKGLMANRKQQDRIPIMSKIKLESGRYGLVVVHDDDKTILSMLDEEGNPTGEVKIVQNQYLSVIQEGFMDHHKDNVDIMLNALLGGEGGVDAAIDGCLSNANESTQLSAGSTVTLKKDIMDVLGRVKLNEGDVLQILDTKGTETRVRIKGTDIMTMVHTKDLTEEDDSVADEQPKGNERRGPTDPDDIEAMIDKMVKPGSSERKDSPKVDLDDTDEVLLSDEEKDEELLINLDTQKPSEEAPDATPDEVPPVDEMPTDILPNVKAEIGSDAGIPIPAQTAAEPPEEEVVSDEHGADITAATDKLLATPSAPPTETDAAEGEAGDEEGEEEGDEGFEETEPERVKKAGEEEETEKEKPEESVSRMRKLTRLTAEFVSSCNPGLVGKLQEVSAPNEETIPVVTDPTQDELDDKDKPVAPSVPSDVPQIPEKNISLTVTKGTNINIKVESKNPPANESQVSVPDSDVSEATRERSKKLTKLTEMYSL